MLFTTGDLITLGIVLIVLFLYRQLDRDNRSLEKVRKYAEKLRDDLDGYVDKRTEDLKRYGIEFDVQQKAAKEVLRRIQGLEESLTQKAQGIEGIEKRLSEYDTALARLMEMTARVDENLLRIQEESEFTESLAKRVDAAKKSLVAIESELPRLRDGFIRDNREALASFKEGILAETGRRLQETESRLERAKAEAEATYLRAEEARRTAAAEFDRAFENARAEAESLEGAAFEKLRAASEAKAARLKETVEEKFAQIGQAAKDRAAETQALVKGMKNEWMSEAEGYLEATRTEIGRLAEDLGQRLDLASAKTRALEAEVESRYGAVEKRSEELAQTLAEKAKALLASQKETVEKEAGEIRALIASLKDALAAQASESAQALSAQKEATERSLAEILAKTAALEAEVDHRYSSVDRKSEELAQSLAEKAKAGLLAQKEAFETAALEAKSQTEAHLLRLAETVAAAREGAAKAGAELDALIAKAEAETAEAGSRLSRKGEEAIATALSEMERRLSEYGSEVEGKFARLEAVNVDIAGMEAALRAAMAESGRRVEGEFLAFGEAMEERRGRFEDGFRRDMEGLKNSVAVVSEELATLRDLAYRNVSEALAEFEADFAADLAARRESAEQRLEAWKAETDRALAELSASARSERAEAERGSLDELRSRMAETQARVYEQLETIRTRAEAIQDGVRAQADSALEALASLKESVRKDAEEARRTAQIYIEGEGSRLAAEIEERLKAAERRTEEGLSRIASAMAEEEERIRATREETAAAAREFSSGLASALKEKDEELLRELEAWKKANASLISELRQDYEGQRDGILAKAREERGRLERELESLSEKTAELRREIAQRSAQILEDVKRAQDAFLIETERREREAQAEAEARIRTFGEAAADIVERVEAGKAQALGAVEKEVERLDASIVEIDRGMRAFVAQTKLFDKADELAVRLASSIETMQADLGRLDARKAELAAIESELTRAKRLEEEASQKLARFLAEKRRIDALEEDFGRLAVVAQGVDKKLEEVTAQSDALTEAQAKIRKVLELSAESEIKYERLEKKAQVLDATVDAVDKNFEEIQNLEKLLSNLAVETKRLPERISDIKRSVDELASSKDRAESAARKLEELDSIVSDAERRIAEVQKAREWLARAETRLEEINNQAQEQLKLLSTLLKEEGVDKKGKGAPPASVQDTVRKLARQGWSSDEIARAVKISRGEVELILELGGKL